MDVKEENYRKKMNLGQDGNVLVHLIVINAVLFVVLQFVRVVYLMVPLREEAFYTNVFSWFTLPADLQKLFGRPWTLLTYMFTDRHLLKFLSNMFWLWSFGYILQDLTGNRKLAPIYLYGGLVGALLFILSYYIFPKLQASIPTASLVGANPAIMALAVATTSVAPDYRIFPMINGGIPLWVLTLIFVLVNFSSIGYGDAAAYVANAGGGALGFLFTHQMRKGRDWSVGMNRFFDWINDLFNPNKKTPGRTTKNEFFYNVSGTQPFKKIPTITQKRIDDILDKINQQGYRFLTDEEKEILRRAAEEEDL